MPARAAVPADEPQDTIPQDGIAQALCQDTVPAGPQPVLPASLAPNRPRTLEYTAPSEDGGIERHGDSGLDPYASVSRNDPCPCGSGRKYKRCHGDPRHA